MTMTFHNLFSSPEPNFFDYGETVLLLHCKIQQTTFTAERPDTKENTLSLA